MLEIQLKRLWNKKTHQAIKQRKVSLLGLDLIYYEIKKRLISDMRQSLRVLFVLFITISGLMLYVAIQDRSLLSNIERNMLILYGVAFVVLFIVLWFLFKGKYEEKHFVNSVSKAYPEFKERYTSKKAFSPMMQRIKVSDAEMISILNTIIAKCSTTKEGFDDLLELIRFSSIHYKEKLLKHEIENIDYSFLALQYISQKTTEDDLYPLLLDYHIEYAGEVN